MPRCILSYVNLMNYIQSSKFPRPNFSRGCRFTCSELIRKENEKRHNRQMGCAAYG